MFAPIPEELAKLEKLEAFDKEGERRLFFIREQVEEAEDSNVKTYKVFADAPGYFSAFAFEVVFADNALYMKNMCAGDKVEGKGIPRAMWYWLSNHFGKRIYSSTINPQKAKYDPDFLVSGERGGRRIWEKFKLDEPRVGFDGIEERFYLDVE